MKAFDAFLRVITSAIKALTQVLLVIMVAIITWHVFSRWVLGHATSWAEEISLILIIWFGLVGSTFGVLERYHLRVAIIFKLLPRVPKVAVAYAMDGLVVVFGALLVVGGIQLIMLAQGQTLPATGMSAEVRYIPVPLTGALFIIYGIRNLLWGGPVKDAESADEEKADEHQAEKI